jgi:excisionase family DNA binding protein
VLAVVKAVACGAAWLDTGRSASTGLDEDGQIKSHIVLSLFSNTGMLQGMATTLRERTVLPPDDPADLARFARGLTDVHAPARAKLVGPDGDQIDIPEDLYGVLRDVVNALSQGLAITIAPHNTMLTTQEAADLLNVSRPTLVRLLTDGEIPHSMRGRHRRVLLRDILDYTERTRADRRTALDQMAAEAEDDGLYDATTDTQPSR